MMVFLISFYYNFNEFKMESYNCIRKYILYSLSIAPFKDDAILQDLWEAKTHSSIVMEDKNHLLLYEVGKPTIRIHTGIFKTCLMQHMAQFKKDHFQPDYRFTLSRVIRKCADTPGESGEAKTTLEEKKKATYPHNYTMLNEEMTEMWLFASHEEVSADFHIFQAKSENKAVAEKYDENYVGAMEKNFWGTQFTLWDNGLPQHSFDKIPEGFGSLRKKIIGNSFKTNILSMNYSRMLLGWAGLNLRRPGPRLLLDESRGEIQDEYFWEQASRLDCESFRWKRETQRGV